MSTAAAAADVAAAADAGGVVSGWPYVNSSQGCQIGHFCDQIKVTNLSFAAFGLHSSLWPKATTFLRSQRGYSRPSASTVCCGQRPQHLKSHRSKEF